MTCLAHRSRLAVVQLVCLCLVLGGCSSYRTPGRGAQFNVFLNEDIENILERKPAASWPVNLATVRVQEPGYRSATARGYGSGRYSVVGVRDVEKEEDFVRLRQLPKVAQVVGLNRLLLGGELTSGRPLRQAAAALHADILCIYTFDTQFHVGDAARPLTVFTLGLSPNQTVEVVTTAAAILVDVRTGYVYGACERTARKKSLASAWTSGDAVDRSRLETERSAFEALLEELERLWSGIAREQKDVE